MSQDLVREEWERRIDALLEQMTLEEKVGQMTQSGSPLWAPSGSALRNCWT